MLNRLIYFSVHNRGVVLFATVFLIIAGLWSFRSLPIDAVPDITNNQVQINTVVEGLAPEEIERSITFPVESAMRGLAGVEQVRSITRFGLSQVTIVFREDVEIYRARQLVAEKLQGVAADLPPGSQPELGPVSTGLGEIYQYVLDFKNRAKGPARVEQLMELKTLQNWTIKPRLLTIEGVAEINTTGGFEKQYHLQPDPQKMARYGIHFDEIREALTRVNRNVGGGYVEQTAEQFLVQGVGLLKSPTEIERVPVKTLEGFRIVRIGDVARVVLGRELRTGAATFDGDEVVLGTVMMLLGENSRTVATRIHAKVEEIRQTLPPGVELTTVYNRSDLVNATLETVEHNLLVGAGLVALILLVLLGHLRAALITAVTIPLSLLATFVVMKPLGISGNLMSLGALDFGLIVDGTVIVLDNCVRFIRDRSRSTGRALTRDEVKSAVIEATIEIRAAAGFGQFIIVVVFLPVFALTGVEGKMFIPMASTFVIAVLAAFVLSFTTAPALASWVLSGQAAEKEPRLMRWIRGLYIPAFEWTFRRPRLTLGLGAASVALGVALFGTRGAEFLPQLGEGALAFHMIRPVNASLSQSVDFQKRADQIVASFAEVDHVFSRIGTSEVATDPMGVNVSDTYIMLKPHHEWPLVGGRVRTSAELTEALIGKLNRELPGQTYLASQPIQMRFNELLEGTRADVAVKIFGPDLSTLIDLAKKTQVAVSEVRGAGDVEVDLAGASPVLKIEPLENSLTDHNAALADVLDVVSLALGGEQVGFLYEAEKKFPIVIRLADEVRSNLSLIKNLPVGVGPQTLVPLGRLAQIEFRETYGTISRENSNRRSAVLINLRDRDTESFVREARAVVADKVKLPDGYYFEWGGNFKNLEQARGRLMVLAPLALALVLVMVFAAFGSLAETLLIFACVPMALVGGVIALILNDLPLSISAGIGFIALSGIAVLNGVVLVNFFNQLKAEGQTGKDLVLSGTLVRLRPVMMTALVAVFGFLPMMVSTGVGAEVQKPLATVVIGGVLSSTALTLLVLPVAYSRFEKKMKGRVAH